MGSRARLGVNVDHVATLRQARGTPYPDPVFAAQLAESAGADQITVHLREDRRHICERDVELLRRTVQTRLNLEMALSDEIAEFALRVRPHSVTLVPERREERTTEGGLDCVALASRIAPLVGRMLDAGVVVSLFVEPTRGQIEGAASLGVQVVELHTGRYADADDESAMERCAQELEAATELARSLGIRVAAGHGLECRNVRRLARVDGIEEFNIGHSIVARSLFVGFERAVREMIEAITRS